MANAKNADSDKIAASVADLIDRKLRQGTLEGVDELEAIISAALSQSLAARDAELAYIPDALDKVAARLEEGNFVELPKIVKEESAKIRALLKGKAI